FIFLLFFSSHPAASNTYTLSLHDALPIYFAPITMLATLPNMLVVHPSLNVSSVQELITLLKANPNKYSFGSAGNGTSQHMSGELDRKSTRLNSSHGSISYAVFCLKKKKK